MSESFLDWKVSDEATGSQEAVLKDGSKFEIKTVSNRMTLTFFPKGESRGYQLYHTPANVSMALSKAKQSAENFLSSPKSNNLSNLEAPQKQESTEATYPSLSELESIVNTKLNLSPVEESLNGDDAEKSADVESIKRLIAHPDTTFAIDNYGSVEKYRKMLQAKLAQLQTEGRALGDPQYKGGFNLWNRSEAEKGKWHLVRASESKEKLIKLRQDMLGQIANHGYEYLITPRGLPKGVPSENLRGKVCRTESAGTAAGNGEKIVTLKATDKLSVKYGCLFVNGSPFEATEPEESLDWPKSIDANGNLITWFKGRSSQANTWKPEEISGFYLADEPRHAIPESITQQKHVQMISLITEEANKSLIEKYLQKHSIEGRELNFSAIRTEFAKFKKLNEATLEQHELMDLIDKVMPYLKANCGQETVDDWGLHQITDWVREIYSQMEPPKTEDDWDKIAEAIADDIISDYDNSL
jgi:hypothetical protein